MNNGLGALLLGRFNELVKRQISLDELHAAVEKMEQDYGNNESILVQIKGTNNEVETLQNKQIQLGEFLRNLEESGGNELAGKNLMAKDSLDDLTMFTHS